MRIVIDLQGAQTARSRSRGIGRYTLSFAKGIIRNSGSHEVLIALNGLFGDTIEPIRNEFEGLLPQQNIRVWHSPGPVGQIDGSNLWRRQSAELVREAFLAALKPDILHISSLFEGDTDDAVTSIGVFAQIPTSVTLYDLSPFIHRQQHPQDSTIESWHGNKLGHLRRADVWLAISECSRQQGIEYLSLPKARSVNVFTAADERFQVRSVTKETASEVHRRYSLQRPFVMSAGVVERSRNIEGLIRAYALLPGDVRRWHQLAVVGQVNAEVRRSLERLASSHGLAPDELVVTGFVHDDDLTTLYNLCTLFVLPSLHEGLSLPALEAMGCGAPVIGANTSSVREVIGRDDALFDAHDEQSIADKIGHALTDEARRDELIRHGHERTKKFSWDATARRAISAFEEFHAAEPACKTTPLPTRRPKLAFIAPLPPERSGIADYSAELLPELARHYDIDVIVSQDFISDPSVKSNCALRRVDWFIDNAWRFDRILYHFGNSTFHQHMFALLEQFPGVVVLHDFFLSGVLAQTDLRRLRSDGWATELYRSHGYGAVQERFRLTDLSGVVFKYPCNLRVLMKAMGIIVHSDFSRRLANEWYGDAYASDWAVIPLLRARAESLGRTEARQAMGLNDDFFVICSFGSLAPTKQNHRLLNAWLSSDLARDDRCMLIFVGENDKGDYGVELRTSISRSAADSRIRITGWADVERYRRYLACADVAVQLRTLSRGETSAAVLDCMNYGLPTIVNANGSNAYLPSNAVWMLPDTFADSDLVAALETLRSDHERREALSKHARELIRAKHAPRACADQYFDAIERMHARGEHGLGSLAKAIARLDRPSDQTAWPKLASAIAQSLPSKRPTRQLLVDVSGLTHSDLKSGIERVVRSILAEFLANPPAGFRVEPVYATTKGDGYRYAREFTFRFLNCSVEELADEPVEVFSGDIFLGLEWQPHIVPAQAKFFRNLRRIGAEVHFVVYDLLPVLLPECFPEDALERHERWLTTLSRGDGAVCISRSVADELFDWLAYYGSARHRPFEIGWFHLGADLASSLPTVGIPEDAGGVLENLSARPTFLSVSTLEPRKGYAQTLAAFESLWDAGVDVNLVIVGRRGWMIERLIETMKSHPQLDRRLFWLESISDEYLEKVYHVSTCLIFASAGEGFGLPLAEAASHGLPIIARDIPVFREVAGDHALYFCGKSPEALATAVQYWLTLHSSDAAPKSAGMPLLTWQQSALQLLEVLQKKRRYLSWMSGGTSRYRGADRRLHTQVGKRDKGTMVSTGRPGYLIFGPYVALEAGNYRVKIHGTAGPAIAEHSRSDVAIGAGSTILADARLASTDQEDCLACLPVTLCAPCSDLEVRVWVDAEAAVAVSLIQIERLALHQGMT